MDLTVHNTVLLDTWWNMLIKFSKQIGYSFWKIIIIKINTKVNSKLCQTSEMERTQNLAKYLSKILQKHQLFAKSEKPFTIFGKISIMHF